MARELEMSLLPTAGEWTDIPVPVLADGTPSSMYQAQWRSLIKAAQSIGWEPGDVAQHGVEGLAAELGRQGKRTWKPNTVARYGRLAAYAGVGVDRDRFQPVDIEPTVISDPQRLWRAPNVLPASSRNALAAIITWRWPQAALDDIRNLRTEHLDVASGDLIIRPGQVRIAGAAVVWERWLPTLVGWETNWVICNTTGAPKSSKPGHQLSRRGFQYGFERHAVAAGYPSLTWNHYRRQALTNQC